jgi:hypothetical protein
MSCNLAKEDGTTEEDSNHVNFHSHSAAKYPTFWKPEESPDLFIRVYQTVVKFTSEVCYMTLIHVQHVSTPSGSTRQLTQYRGVEAATLIFMDRSPVSHSP